MDGVDEREVHHQDAAPEEPDGDVRPAPADPQDPPAEPGEPLNPA